MEGLADQLEIIQGQLSLCEKALAEYLETKRLAFPRFYFASSNDLLDILSNGNQPIKVSPAQPSFSASTVNYSGSLWCVLAKTGFLLKLDSISQKTRFKDMNLLPKH